MTRLINADDIPYVTDETYLHEYDYAYRYAIDALPTVEPTLYGYKIEHLALIARVMQKDGVTPEQAVQVFKDVQTIALKVIDEINGIIERTFEQATETICSGDDTAEWIIKEDPVFADKYYCSNCGEQANVDLYGEWILSKYCPNCGARMDETKYKYVTLHHEDIHFINEDAEKTFYESLAERKEE